MTTDLPYYATDGVTLHLGDCLDVLPALADASVGAVVTDPPYELGFMGKAWDASGIAYNTEVWRQCWRVLKPGGHLAAFGGTRTYHRLAAAIEDAGFEVRDSLHWIYGSGFPKSLDVSKAIDKAAGAQREVIGQYAGPDGKIRKKGVSDTYAQDQWTRSNVGPQDVTAPATVDAARWEGWGTALKPAHEPIVLARKPLAGTVAATVLAHGTGALNIDGCRTQAGQDYRDKCASVVGLASNRNGDAYGEWTGVREDSAHAAGRWPTNILLGHAPECADACSPGCPVAELGSEARFFPAFRYEAKAPASERPRLDDGTAHTTVKPLALMRWLVRLITPPGGTVLDPFAGSGTTLEACRLESFRSVGVEMDAAHVELCRVRLNKPYMVDLFGDTA